MKKTIIILFATFCNVLSNAQGIHFINNLNWHKIQAIAKKENKYILMDTYATWCVPCKQMSTEVFSNKDVGNLVNDKFIAVQVQMDRTNQDVKEIKSWYHDAMAIGKLYKITAYPTVLFFSPEGKLVHRAVGYRDAIGLIKEVKTALDPNSQFYTLFEQYNKGKMDTASMKKLIFMADAVSEKLTARQIAANYTSYINAKDFYKKDHLLFIGAYLDGSKDRNFNLFLNQPKVIDSIVGHQNFAENVVMGIIHREEIAQYDTVKIVDWPILEKRIIAKYGVLGEERIWGTMMLYYNDRSDWENFGKYYKLYFDRAIPNNRSFVHMNNISWPIVEHITDPEILSTAITTMKYTIEKFDGNVVYSLDTYANLLYKVGRVKDAIDVEEKAVKLSNYEKEIVDTLIKMKSGIIIYK